jgi:hypothetical protein
MLPPLRKKQEAAILSSDKMTREPDSPDDLHYLRACLEEFLEHVESGDMKAAARAFKDCFEVCDAMPHEEGEHI